MTRTTTLLTLMLCATPFITVGCRRSSDDVWNDSKSAGRHVSRGVKTLGGKHGESREVRSASDFSGENAKNADFVGLDDEQGQNFKVSDSDQIAQAKETPGELGSSIPGIDAFKDPSEDPNLAPIFKNLHFEYNSSLLKGDENMAICQSIAEFMKSHSNVYVFVEGHCDKRGPAAFNLALGANRSNSIRNVLIKEGVDGDHIFTVSYGKERPLVEGDGEEFFQINRRGQFRVYEKN
ncbi:MAG: pal [Chlamydiia bacterium]|nr:pal [Chlamydiia bacterium]